MMIKQISSIYKVIFCAFFLFTIGACGKDKAVNGADSGKNIVANTITAGGENSTEDIVINTSTVVGPRVVSLGPAATEILFAIGAGKNLVARTDFCNYPEAALALPSVGGFSSADISLEKIVSFEPDVVFLFQDMHGQFIKPLQDLGIEVFVIQSRDIEELENEIVAAGKITGHKDEALQVVKKMNDQLLQVEKNVKAVKKNSPDKNYNLFWQIWNEPLMTVGQNSFLNDVIEKSGWKNIFGQQPAAYPVVGAEAVLEANPALVVITGTSKNPEGSDSLDGGDEFLKLLKQQNPDIDILYFIEEDIFMRPSPRCVEAVKKLSEFIK